MPVTPGRDILPLSEAPHNLLPAAFRSLERLNEENEEEEKMVGDPAAGERQSKSKRKREETIKRVTVHPF